MLSGPHGRHAILDVMLSRPEDVARLDPQGLPGRPDPRHGSRISTSTRCGSTSRSRRRSRSSSIGESPGVKEGGVLSALVREVSVEALPLEMPDRLLLDIGDTEIGSTLRVADLVAPEGSQILDDPDTVVVTVAAPRVEVEEEVPEEELAEGEERPEGEEPAAEGEDGAPAADEGESGTRDEE